MPSGMYKELQFSARTGGGATSSPQTCSAAPGVSACPTHPPAGAAAEAPGRGSGWALPPVHPEAASGRRHWGDLPPGAPHQGGVSVFGWGSEEMGWAAAVVMGWAWARAVASAPAGPGVVTVLAASAAGGSGGSA